MSLANQNTDVGFASMRMQPLHNGHKMIIDAMVSRCAISIVGLGSCQESRTKKNPFTIEERKFMVRQIFGDSVKFVELYDIGAKNNKEWVDYCFTMISKSGFPLPNTYFTGSDEDAKWYVDYFYPENFDGDFKETQIDDYGRRRTIYSLERHKNSIPSATEIRQSLIDGDDTWKKHIPLSNHEFVSKNFPGFL